LAAAIIAVIPAIGARRILLRRVVPHPEVLRRRCVGFRLPLLRLGVRLTFGVRLASRARRLCVGVGFMTVSLRVAIVEVDRFGIRFAVFGLEAGFFRSMAGVGLPSKRFAGQNLDRRGENRGRMRLGMTVAVVVIFQVFEYVADVQKCVAIQSNINEG